MEGDELLSVKTFHPTIIKTAKSSDSLQTSFFIYGNIKSNKRALTFFDTIITVAVVTPLVIGFWAGTWNLLEIYKSVFPPYETFFLGGICHLCFAVVKEGLQDLIKFEDKSWPKVALAFIVRRTYTYFFAVTSILNWCSGWILYDIWIGLTSTMTYKDVPAVTFYLNLCVLLTGAVTLICFRSVRNILAVPFVIGLDTKTTAFTFPTRYNKTVCYTTFYAISKSSKTKKNNATSIEKLVTNDVTVERQLIKNVSPRPFGNDFRGELPSGFSPSIVQTTTSYNHYSNHKVQPQPHNIQDIIQYLTENVHPPNYQRDSFKLIGTAHGIKKSESKNYAYTKVRFPQDPFFAYKPQDPSDINLMAPNGFRFAPPIPMPNSSKKIRNVNQKFINEAESNLQSVTKTGKPISLTLNIYPSRQERNLMPRYHYNPSNNFQPVNQSEKMVLHLNIYPKQNDLLQNPRVF